MNLENFFSKNHSLKILYLIIFLTCFMQTHYSQTCGQPKNVSLVVSNETFNKVLDIVFPRPIKKSLEINSYFVLRFNPSFEANSQIIFKKFAKGNGGELIEYKTTGTNIYDKINEIYNKICVERPEEMAKQLNVEIKSRKLSNTESNLLRQSFFTNLSKSLLSINKSVKKSDVTNEVEITLDGTTYELWANFDNNDLFFSFHNNEINNSQITGSLPIIKWMNQIRLSVKN